VGKTTLLERAVRSLESRGLRVLAVKSSHHDLDDRVGSDSDRLAQAGAQGVLLLAPNGMMLGMVPPLQPEDLLPLLASRYDAALIEGGKTMPFPKVELIADQPAMLPHHAVVGTLARGTTPECPLTLQRLLDFWAGKGQFLGASKV
jgi:molybdopterin-guanine dinucleotide biosynthesis protein B